MKLKVKSRVWLISQFTLEIQQPTFPPNIGSIMIKLTVVEVKYKTCVIVTSSEPHSDVQESSFEACALI